MPACKSVAPGDCAALLPSPARHWHKEQEAFCPVTQCPDNLPDFMAAAAQSLPSLSSKQRLTQLLWP